MNYNKADITYERGGEVFVLIDDIKAFTRALKKAAKRQNRSVTDGLAVLKHDSSYVSKTNDTYIRRAKKKNYDLSANAGYFNKTIYENICDLFGIAYSDFCRLYPERAKSDGTKGTDPDSPESLHTRLDRIENIQSAIFEYIEDILLTVRIAAGSGMVLLDSKGISAEEVAKAIDAINRRGV